MSEISAPLGVDRFVRHTVLVTLAFTALLIISGSSALAQVSSLPSAASVVPPPTTFTFDAGKYAYLTVQLAADGAKVFDGACPKSGNLLGLDFNDILLGSGKRAAKITVEIELPPVSGAARPKVKLDPLTIVISKPLLGRHKCEITLEAFDFSSPLFYMAAYGQQNFTVRTAVYTHRDGVGALFADSLDGAVAAANSVSAVPVDAVVKIGAIGKLLRNAGSSETKSSSGVDFKLVRPDDNPTTAKDWPLASGVTGFPSNITVKARLRVRDTLFERQGTQWTPEDVMQTSFPAKGTAGTIRTYILDPSVAATAYNQFTVAANVEAAGNACVGLMGEIDKMGLSAKDRAIVKWALVRSHPTLRTNPALDHLQCVDGIFGLLPTHTADSTIIPNEFAQRPLVSPQSRRLPNDVEISSAVEGSSRLARFLKFGPWPQRSAAAQRLFANPHDFLDVNAIGVLNGATIKMISPSDWLANQWDTARPLATNVGCYSWSGPGKSDVPQGTMYAVARFVTGADGAGRKDALIRIMFAPLVEQAAGEARIAKFEIFASPDPAAIVSVKSRHGANCGEDSDWAPDLLK